MSGCRLADLSDLPHSLESWRASHSRTHTRESTVNGPRFCQLDHPDVLCVIIHPSRKPGAFERTSIVLCGLTLTLHSDS